MPNPPQNHLGRPRQVLDDNNELVWQLTPTDFGGVVDKALQDKTGYELNLRFTGQYFDQESGYHYNYHRYYDPSLDRYLTSDPIGLAGGDNMYAYVGNSPIHYNDPVGLLLFAFDGTGNRDYDTNAPSNVVKFRVYESNNENAHTHISTLHKNLFEIVKLQTPKYSTDELASDIPRQKLVAAVISSAMRNDEVVNLSYFTESQGYKERTASYGIPPKPEGAKLLDYTKILNAQQDIALQKSVNSLEKQQNAMVNLELLNTDLFNSKEILMQQQSASVAQEQIERSINKRLENPTNDQAYLDKVGKDFAGAAAEHISDSFDKTQEYAKNFVSKGSDTKELINFHNGYKAIISSNNLDKMLSNDTLKAVANNQQAEGSQINLLAHQYQTMDINKEGIFSI